VPEVSKAKSLARILALVLCPCLLFDSPSELQKAQDLFARGSLAEVATVFRQVVQDDRSNPDAHLLLGTALALQGLRVCHSRDRDCHQYIYQLGESAKPIEYSVTLSSAPRERAIWRCLTA
jgi:hypothetical protein